MPVPPSEPSGPDSGFDRERSSSSSGAFARASSSNRLISDGDSVARNAFRIGLRDETPLPVSPSLITRAAPAAATQELDPNDILEVQDMAAAIARAEMLLASPAPTAVRPAGRFDLFETLGRRPTDDTAGPATPAPASEYTYASPATPLPPAPPRYLTMPAAVVQPEDDAFYHPVGRIRSLADVTLDGYRPEPTLLVRAASRRKRFSWILVAVLLPLLVLAAIAIFAATDSPADSTAFATLPRPRMPTTAAAGRTPLATSSGVAKGAVRAATPVFDVNSLPTARSGR